MQWVTAVEDYEGYCRHGNALVPGLMSFIGHAG